MIKDVEIKTMEGVMQLAFEQKRNDRIGRLRSSYLYRGMPNADFRIRTSLQRNCKDEARALEAPMLENFIKYMRINDPSINESIWKAMIIGQHYGLPTRLLDWSRSALVSLHFAHTEGNPDDMDKHDCVVWRVDAREINQKLPDKYRNRLDMMSTFIFSVESLKEVTEHIADYDMDMGSDSFVFLEPPSINQRIVNQYSFFSVMPAGIEDVIDYLDRNTENTVRYIIDRKLRWDVRDTLDEMNMSERMIYPGIEGVAKWIARHYFVRQKDE